MINKAETNIIEKQQNSQNTEFLDSEKEINLLIQNYKEHLQEKLESSCVRVKKIKE